MEFRLPESIAKHLNAYDETLRQQQRVEKKKEREDSNVLKRRTTLDFPCPDIFFDLDAETIHGIYTTFCSLAAPARYMLISDDQDVARYFVTWSKPKGSIAGWFVWKIIDAECPIALRSWSSNDADDYYVEWRADQSMKAARCILENPFTSRLKTEKVRYEQLSQFFKSITRISQVHTYLNTRVSRYHGLDKYFDRKHFYEKNFPTSFNKTTKEFSVINAIAHDLDVHELADHKCIRTTSAIVNSKFYQSQVHKEIARQQAEIVEYNNTPDFVKLKTCLQLVYVFLLIYPEEYDRSVHLFNELDSFYIEKGQVGKIFRFYNLHYAIQFRKAAYNCKFFGWFRDKVTPQMFCRWLVDTAEETIGSQYRSTMNDTFNMLTRVYTTEKESGQVLPVPKRWRLEETHDHYCGLILQLDNQLVSLPQDLIPVPIQFNTDLGQVSMFQPATNHEVIRWGRAVRNCVGSAGYDKRVMDKKAFLVFAELNGKPWLTSLLTVNMGMLHVGQTVSPSNSNLSQQENTVYHGCLQNALNLLAETID